MSANRALTFASHIPCNSGESQTDVELADIRHALAVATVRSEFHMSSSKLKQMVVYFHHEMVVGLTKPQGASTLKMLPSYVYRKPTEGVSGVFYALDLGGTNFRVLRMEIMGGKLREHVSKQFAIPVEHMRGKQEGLFDFIAACVKGQIRDSDGRVPMGFTFSFPIQQTGIASGNLIQWTKGFATTGVVGENIVGLLQAAFQRAKVSVQVVALCNDTVGTLVTKYFSEPNTRLGVILGTGSNACYWEKASNVTKEPGVASNGDRDTIINMEFGNFDSLHNNALKQTKYDRLVDKQSLNPGAYHFEKMISGYYMGEIARQVFIDLVSKSVLPKWVGEKYAKPYSFQSITLSRILTDQSYGHLLVRKYFNDGAIESRQLELIREICLLVRNRSAQLAAMAISATLLKTHHQHRAVVAIDGSVFEKTAGYREVMQETVKMLLGNTCRVELVLQKDGSGLGAGFIAALQN